MKIGMAAVVLAIAMGGITGLNLSCAADSKGEPNVEAGKSSPPNIIIVLTDDEGYGDRAAFYSPTGLSSPNYDRFIREGMRFSDFYVGASVCSPSRAALLTGCYPQRVGLPVVLEADPQIGLNANEQTLPKLLKAQGYATACIGKWHLGDRPEFLPTWDRRRTELAHNPHRGN